MCKNFVTQSVTALSVLRANQNYVRNRQNSEMLVMIKCRKNVFPSHLGDNVNTRIHTVQFTCGFVLVRNLAPQ